MAKKGKKSNKKMYIYIGAGALAGIIALCVAIPQVKSAVMDKLNAGKTSDTLEA